MQRNTVKALTELQSIIDKAISNSLLRDNQSFANNAFKMDVEDKMIRMLVPTKRVNTLLVADVCQKIEAIAQEHGFVLLQKSEEQGRNGSIMKYVYTVDTTPEKSSRDEHKASLKQRKFAWLCSICPSSLHYDRRKNPCFSTLFCMLLLVAIVVFSIVLIVVNYDRFSSAARQRLSNFIVRWSYAYFGDSQATVNPAADECVDCDENDF